MKKPLATIIMAGGMGKRMKSDLPKVLHKIAGKPMVIHVIELSKLIGADRIIVVVGYGREMVRKAAEDLDVEWAVQEQQLGTGDAVRSCKEHLEDFDGDVLVLSGDVPLLSKSTIIGSIHLHQAEQAASTVLTFKPDDPQGYGRIIRNEKGDVSKIVEHKDANEDEKLVNEVNSGIYLFDCIKMFKYLEKLSNDNAAGEYYLTDTLGYMVEDREKVSAFFVENQLELSGVNSKEQLFEMEKELSRR